MIKKISDVKGAVKSALNEAAKQSLLAGKGNRAIGTGTSGISVGDEFTLESVDFRESIMPQRGMSNEEWSALSDAEKTEKGVLRNWYEFVCPQGNLSVSTVMGNKDMFKEDFWTPQGTTEDDEFCVVSDDFDFTKIFQPSTRNPYIFITDKDVDGLLTKTLKCVGIKQQEVTDSQGNTIKVRSRAFMQIS